MSHSFSRTMRDDERETNRERDTSKVLVFHTRRSNAYTIYTRQNKGNPTTKPTPPQKTSSSHTKTRANSYSNNRPSSTSPSKLPTSEKERGVMPSYPSQIPRTHTHKKERECDAPQCPAKRHPPTQDQTQPNPTSTHIKEGRQTNKPTSSTHQHPPPQTPQAVSDPP